MLSDAPVCVIDREVGAVGALRTAGLDYAKNRSLRELLRSHRIQHRVIPPRTSERNGALRSTLAREASHRPGRDLRRAG